MVLKSSFIIGRLVLVRRRQQMPVLRSLNANADADLEYHINIYYNIQDIFYRVI